MKIREIFAKNIDRKINPAVVVTQQEKDIIKTEIEEYVFTADLIDNLYKFLNDLLFRTNGKTGIWINGYYGSGKSHFIKYAHYCLESETSEDAFNHFIENAEEHADSFSDATPSNISQLKNRITASEVDNIMFNIDAVSGQRDDPDKITRIILNQFNRFRGYNGKNIPLALLVEKHMDKLGKFDEFKKEINKQGNYNWDKEAAQLASLMLDTVLDVMMSIDDSLDRDSLRQKLKYPDDISIEGDLIPEFIDYLEDKPDDYRLIFLVDEVSQYIGTNTNLLLNLQTIIEEIGAKCGSRIWFVSTAQQTLDQVVGNSDITADDFGKILGRFETRISLESQQADYITKVRVLGKSSEGIGSLQKFYKKNKDAIENQFQFSHELYHGYEHVEEFNMSYPFIPYQFRLISDVFESFSNLNYVVKEVRDNERSVLGITHFTVQRYCDENIGYFIPFDAFFNEQFKQNLTHAARRIIERAINLEFVKNDKFAQRVVSVLFMVSNLTDTKKITFPVILDNLSILLMEEPDTNKLDLQRKIQNVLDELTNQNIIREEDGQYHFFKEDEIDVSAEVQNTVITSEGRLTALHDDIFSKMIQIQKKYGFGNNNFNLAISFGDKDIFNQGDVNVTFSFYDSEDISQKALGLSRNDLVFCLNDLLNDEPLMSDFNRYVQTKKYIRQHYDSATGTRRKTLDNFATRNKNKLSEIQKKFENLFKTAPIISGQQVLKPGELTNSAPGARYQEALNLHFESIYKKHDLIKGFAGSNDELLKSAKDKQISAVKTLSHAEEAVNNWVSNSGDSVVLDEVIKHFAKVPYGWKDLSTIDVLIHLAQKDKRQFEWRNERIDLLAFYQKAIKRTERIAIVIKPVDEVDPKTIQQTVSDYKSIFNESLAEMGEPNRVHQEIVAKLSKKSGDFKSFAIDYSREPFGKHFQNFVNSLNELSNTREPIRLFEKLKDQKTTLKTLSDNCKELKEFIESQYSNYKVIKEFTQENDQNFTNLDEVHQKKAQTLHDYFNEDDIPSAAFPQIRQAYNELGTEIKKLKKDLVKTVVKAYEKVYEEVDEKAKEEGVSDKSLFTSKDEKIGQIKTEQNIAKLQLALAKTGSFKATCLKAISDSVGKKSVTFKASGDGLPSQIENEDQLEDYLTKLKNKLLKVLKDGKTIIIE